jgi:hypothetical protein
LLLPHYTKNLSQQNSTAIKACATAPAAWRY